MKQLSFTSIQREIARTEHGGSIKIGRRKLSRPIDVKRPLHLVLRSSRARGGWSMRLPETQREIRNAMRRHARRHGVRVYEFASSGNHLHLLVRAKTRFGIQNFLISRCVSGRRIDQ